MKESSFEPSSRKYIFLLFGFIFIATLVFFSSIHPVTIVSGDDWGNLARYRSALPEWGGFNPVKAIPEISFPIVARLSSLVLVKFGVNFFFAISMITAFITSVLCTIFLYGFFVLLSDKTKGQIITASTCTFIYFLFMFGFFKSEGVTNSYYLLWEINITCFYHYLFPALINGSFVLFLINKENSKSYDKKHSVNFLIIISIVTYACIFSNIFASVILASYCGSVILLSLISNKFHFTKTAKEKSLQIYISAVWLISVVFEMNGGRASQIEGASLDISGSINKLWSFIGSANGWYIALINIGIVAGLLITTIDLTRSKKTAFSMTYTATLMSWIFSTVALILLCAKASSSYAERPVAMWAFYMYPIILSLYSVHYLSVRYKFVAIILPIYAFVLLNIATMPQSSLRESQNLNLTYEKATQIGELIISQVTEAVNSGKSEAIVLVPKGDDKDNWPFPVYNGKKIENALLDNNIIVRKIKITITPDPSLNEKLGIPQK
jgi:hypothetical protein